MWFGRCSNVWGTYRYIHAVQPDGDLLLRGPQRRSHASRDMRSYSHFRRQGCHGSSSMGLSGEIPLLDAAEMEPWTRGRLREECPPCTARELDALTC
jgi:hypothetical protein